MRLPIDTSAIKFAAAGPSEPVLVFATKAQWTDENGIPIFQVAVFADGSGVKNSITIKVAGEASASRSSRRSRSPALSPRPGRSTTTTA